MSSFRVSFRCYHTHCPMLYCHPYHPQARFEAAGVSMGKRSAKEAAQKKTKRQKVNVDDDSAPAAAPLSETAPASRSEPGSYRCPPSRNQRHKQRGSDPGPDPDPATLNTPPAPSPATPMICTNPNPGHQYRLEVRWLRGDEFWDPEELLLLPCSNAPLFNGRQGYAKGAL